MINKASGFSLIESVVVLVFLGIAAIVLSHLFLAQETELEQKMRQARDGITLLNNGIGAYVFDTGNPTPKNYEELQILVKTGYFKELPIDPWGREYQYQNPPIYSGKFFDLYSLGPDGVESEDDIVNWDLYGGRVERHENALN